MRAPKGFDAPVCLHEPVEHGAAPAGEDGRERGFVLAWMAMMILVLLGFAGFAVDVGNWYLTASRTQNAADAAALGGVVFMPADFPGARDVAIELAGGHGYDASKVTVEPGERHNQLRVTVTEEVDNFFVSLFGLDKTTISRDALAEFEGPVPMGSPEAFLGDDPELGHSPDFWMNVAGQRNNTGNGDRYQAGLCHTNTGCQSPSGVVTNSSYSEHGYFFAVDVLEPNPSKPLVIEIYDPGFYELGDTCGSGNLNTIYGSAANVPTLAANLQAAASNPALSAWIPAGWYDDAANRYQRGNSDWCSGDWQAGAATGGNGPVNTTYIVREPDGTPWIDSDNPVINTATCSPIQFPGRSISWMESNGGIWGKLTPSAGSDEWKVTFPAGETWKPTLANSFRRWVRICEIPAAQVQQGQYLLQVKTNAPLGAPLATSMSADTYGHNRYSIRAGFGTATDGDFGVGLRMFANGRFPIYANADGTDTTFYLARVLPGASNRVLNLTLWDISDGGSAGNMRILPPADSNMTSFSGCSFSKIGGTWSTNSSNCSISFNAGALNAALVTVSVPIPADYDCNASDTKGCWITVHAPFTGAVSDTTTWSADMNGDPVRLVE